MPRDSFQEDRPRPRRRNRAEDEEQVEDLEPRRPRKKEKATSVGLWIGLGVGGVLLLGLIGVAVALVIYFTKSGGGGAGGSATIKQMPGLLAYWSFDEVEGDKVIDQSGRNNHARLMGIRVGPGMRGQGLVFDNNLVHSYCDLGAADDLNFAANAPFTFAGWFQTSNSAATVLSLRHSKRSPQQIDLVVRDEKLMVIVGDNQDPGKNNAFVGSKQHVNHNQWYHFAFTRTGATIELFVDGQSQGQMSAPNSGGPISSDLRALGNERLWALDNDWRWGPPTFKGSIDEVCVFNRALTAAEIRKLAEK